jgi:hypothetical protein
MHKVFLCFGWHSPSVFLVCKKSPQGPSECCRTIFDCSRRHSKRRRRNKCKTNSPVLIPSQTQQVLLPGSHSWCIYLIYIYIGRDIRGPTTAKAGTRQKGKPTNPTSNLWISFSLVCSSPNPFESLKKNYCTYPLMTQTLFRFGDLSSNLCPTLQIDTPAKKNTYQVCLFFYIGLANQD